MQANLVKQGDFLAPPQPVLYPCVWGNDDQMLPKAKAAFVDAFLDVVTPTYPDIRSQIRFWVIGSGACFNWDENGDIDIQIWIADPAILVGVRSLIGHNLYGKTCADYGLATDACPGKMSVQFYAKTGRGTAADNLAEQPYAAYDMDKDSWLVKPVPMTPQMYGDIFLLVEPRAQAIAAEADDALAAYERARLDAAFWAGLEAEHDDPRYAAQAAQSQQVLTDRWNAVVVLFKQVFAGRQEAYTPTGLGIHDDRDAIVKLLETWGVWDRLKHVGQGSPGVTET